MEPFLRSLLQVVAGVSAAWLGLMMIYQMGLSIFGFKRKGKDYQDHDPESRFLVLGVHLRFPFGRKPVQPRSRDLIAPMRVAPPFAPGRALVSQRCKDSARWSPE